MRIGRLTVLALLLPALLSACVGPAVHSAAVEAQTSARILRAASVPNPAYSEAERASWERLWARHEDALRAVEEASK